MHATAICRVVVSTTCTFTAPEVASVGVRTGGALPRGVKTITKQLAHVDRAIVDGDTTGFITLAYNAKGVVVGATGNIVCRARAIVDRVRRKWLQQLQGSSV